MFHNELIKSYIHFNRVKFDTVKVCVTRTRFNPQIVSDLAFFTKCADFGHDFISDSCPISALSRQST